MISETSVLFFYIDFLAGFEKQAKNQYKNQYFPNCPLVSPFPFGPQTLHQHQPHVLGGCMSYAQYFFKAVCYPLPRIRTISQKMEHILCQGLAPSLPFQRGVLSQGQFLPFVKGCFPFLKGHALKRMCSSHPFSRDALSQGVPFLKGCPFSRAFGNLPFCKGSILLQGSVLVSFPFPRDVQRAPGLRWQCPFARGLLLH